MTYFTPCCYSYEPNSWRLSHCCRIETYQGFLVQEVMATGTTELSDKWIGRCIHEIFRLWRFLNHAVERRSQDSWRRLRSEVRQTMFAVSSSSFIYLTSFKFIYIRVVQCSRWSEMTESLRFHVQLAHAAQSPTEFRMLNGATMFPGRHLFWWQSLSAWCRSSTSFKTRFISSIVFAHQSETQLNIMIESGMQLRRQPYPCRPVRTRRRSQCTETHGTIRYEPDNIN